MKRLYHHVGSGLPLALVLALFLLPGCKDNATQVLGESQIKTSSLRIISAYPSDESTRIALRASATLDDVNVMELAPSSDEAFRLTAETGDLQPGVHEVKLTYYITQAQDITLATAKRTVTITPGAATDVFIDSADMDRNYDDDADGYTNLEEALRGTNCLDQDSYPQLASQSLVGIFSVAGDMVTPGYDMKLEVGETVVGSSNSISYTLSTR